ncbi:PH domain-containing protein [Sphingobacterium bovistauri]|uniref:PH domain-containing protein n=1 Tax=Sphingobacterium bovistauri TaxID=2781959 RepID=A0ABS7Z5Z3_9SPHI|nr:PH domain-containing protein [Sphingobacterium bovistauri]MCA5005610.1 PH domain-containing protein [Sphingobacterium bovistauri]
MSLDKFIQDGQEPKVIEKIYSKIETMLNRDETVTYIALQKKPAVTLLPDSITISNKRIFLCEFTKLGLSTNFEIFDWKDIKDIAFKEEIFGSKVTVIPFTGENLSIDYIPKTQARRLYQLIKEVLEEIKSTDSKEDNRPNLQTAQTVVKPIVPIRNIYEESENEIQQSKIEESPIVSAVPEIETPKFEPIAEPEHTYVAPTVIREYEAPAPTFTPAPTPIEEVEDELTIKLKKLKSLYDKQLISQSEYENKKADILSQL